MFGSADVRARPTPVGTPKPTAPDRQADAEADRTDFDLAPVEVTGSDADQLDRDNDGIG